jgi:hypothetical protein
MGLTPTKEKRSVTDKDLVILEMKHAKDRLRKLKSKLADEATRFDSIISTYVSAKQKSKAYMVLKLQRYKREELNKVEGQLSNVQDLIDAVEWQIQTNKLLCSLKEGTQILKEVQEAISIDELTKILADNDDMILVEKEYSAIFTRELDQAEKEMIENNFDGTNNTDIKDIEKNVYVFPEVPSSVPHINAEEKQEKWYPVDFVRCNLSFRNNDNHNFIIISITTVSLQR